MSLLQLGVWDTTALHNGLVVSEHEGLTCYWNSNVASLQKFWLLTTGILCFWRPFSIQAFSVTTAPVNGYQGKCTPSASQLKRPHERIISFDTEEFPLCVIVAEALGCHPEELDKLHLREPEEFCEQGKIRGSLASTRSPLRRVELLRRALTTKWKMSPQRRQWENDYLPQIVRDVVGPEVMGQESQLIYQRAPMLRFHVAWQLMISENEEAYDNTVPPIGGEILVLWQVSIPIVNMDIHRENSISFSQ